VLTWHDILTYLRLFLRWWFVIALAVGLSMGTAWAITRQQPDVFSSQATLMVGNNFEVAAPSQAQVSLSNVLADYYAALVKREVILGPVVERLQLSFQWWVVRDRMLMARVDRGANLLELTVTDTNPERAAAIANTVAEQLIAYTPNAPEKVAAQQAEISRQTADAQANIQAIEVKIAELEERLSGLSSAIDLSDVQSQLDALQITRQRYLDEYANLIGLSNQTSANSLSFFEQARIPEVPLPKKRSLTLAMAGAGGLLMAIVAVLVLDRLDERWRTGSELQSRTGIRSLGDVPEEPLVRPGTRPAGPSRNQALNNAYCNMVLAAKSNLPRTLLISSPRSSEARSALAIDIAEMYTRTGHRVLLVDTEADQSNIAGMLGQNGHPAPAASWGGATVDGLSNIWAYVQPTPIHNLLVLSGREAGYDRFSSLVPLVYWPEMLAHLRKSADVVIFAGPSACSGPDAGLLARMVDAVLLVLNGKQDTRSIALRARKQLTSEPATQFLGAIVSLGKAKGHRAAPTPGAIGNGFQIAVSRKGITISLSDKAPTPALNGAAHGVGHRLLNPPEIEVTATPMISDPVTNGSVDADDGPEHVTWEDLIELEHGATTQHRRTNGVAHASHVHGAGLAPDRSAFVSPAAPDLPGPRAIITPPPVEMKTVNGAYARAQPSAASPARPRRARIANSRRPARTNGVSSPLDQDGAESL